MTDLQTGIELISAERTRQITEKGYTVDHDRCNSLPGELAMAGCCYALFACSNPVMRGVVRKYVERSGKPPSDWPWGVEHWRPGKTDDDDARVHELTKAGALIAAEIDRIKARQIKPQTKQDTAC